MTEAEWLACTDPTPMLEFLRGKATERKLRLFACACLRRFWPAFPDEPNRNALRVAERHAEGEATYEELCAALDCPSRSVGDTDYPDCAVSWLGFQDPGQAAGAVAMQIVTEPHGLPYDLSFDEHRGRYVAYEGVRSYSFAVADSGEAVAEREAQAALLRDVVGNPFRPVTANPSWRTPDVLALARAAYEQRSLPAGTLEPARLTLLAGALEDAGCTNDEVLSHLRAPGPHVRGCWALDLIRGKE